MKKKEFENRFRSLLLGIYHHGKADYAIDKETFSVDSAFETGIRLFREVVPEERKWGMGTALRGFNPYEIEAWNACRESILSSLPQERER